VHDATIGEQAEGKSNVTIDLFGMRSLLFLPASRPSAIAKARKAGSDLVILDLEDAVRPEDKAPARGAAVAAASESWPMPLAIRINGTGTPWHDEDVAAVAASQADIAVLPNVRAPEGVAAVAEHVGRPVIAMIESAEGVLAAAEIARRSSAVMLGTNDLSNDLRLPQSGDRRALQTALQMVILAARAAKVPVFDGVFNALDDEQGLFAECRESRSFGFDGKSLIHPRQIDACHRAFAPTDTEIARAERLVAAATGGAERFEGEMVERMHVEAAERLLQRSRT
jgi:citrate lyase subunit beta/citryl-CoA lyase